ncbi:MAG: M14 family metallopeptidase [Gemmatimonadota bacterium]
MAGAMLALAAAVPALAQEAPQVTTPQEALGFNLGDDYHMASYSQLEAWWKKLDQESPRMKLVDMGPTAQGRHQYMAVITSPENQANLDHYREIADRLTHAEGLTEAQARELAREGKAVVWIDGGLHATETVGSQQLMELVYEMVSRTDRETMRFLDDVILLAVQCNPDGQEMVADWYMRKPDEKARNMMDLPMLYHEYVGHDNNRDFFMSNMPETTNMNRVMFRTWYPQIVYNHHQPGFGQTGGVVFVPPFRDPFNYRFDPLIPLEIEEVGAAMNARLVAHDMPGSGQRSFSNYSTWWNGGLRTITYFHNMIGLLTEIIGNPTPVELPLVAAMQLPHNDLPDPVPPQTWHYRQSIDYEQQLNRAVLDYASRNRETLLFNMWRKGIDQVDRGREDSWTTTPEDIAALQKAAADMPHGMRVRSGYAQPTELYDKVLHDPARRDARGYIVSADQPDLPTTVKFVNALIKTGVDVLEATSSFQVAGKRYPAGSYVVKTDQAFAPHAMDMFEPQDHPNDFQYPGGPPIPPYDLTGWTLAFQMGVKFDRVVDGFDGPFKKLDGLQSPPAAAVAGASNPAGYLVSHRYNDGFTLTNRLLDAGVDVYWMKADQTVDGAPLGTGALWIPASDEARSVLEEAARELGVPVHAVSRAPSGEALKLKKPRIGLYDRYGGIIPTGWDRWLFEQYGFSYERVYPRDLDAGDLNRRFDVLVFPDEAYPDGGEDQPAAADIPEKYRGWLGHFTSEKTLPQVEAFVKAGGTVVTVGSSTALGRALGVPVSDHLSKVTADGTREPLAEDEFFIPGSILRAHVNTAAPLAYGMPAEVDVVYDNNPVFDLEPQATLEGVTPVAWFSGTHALRSGWAWGPAHLDGGTAMVDARVGRGRVAMIGPLVTFRGQPHATFKVLFNGVLYGAATPTTF